MAPQPNYKVRVNAVNQQRARLSDEQKVTLDRLIALVRPGYVFTAQNVTDLETLEAAVRAPSPG